MARQHWRTHSPSARCQVLNSITPNTDETIIHNQCALITKMCTEKIEEKKHATATDINE